MLEPRRLQSNVKPNIIENLGNDYWYYYYDLQESIALVPSQEDMNTMVEEPVYSFILIKTLGKPDYKKCVELIIREFITQTQEFDLINSANRALIAGNDSHPDVLKYKEYLTKVDEIKAKVKNDLK